ncbi:alginate export family protein, partial [Planctomycetota bacterium]
MSGKTVFVAFAMALLLGVGALAGEAETPPPVAPVTEPPPPADFFDQLKQVEAAGIVFKFGGEAMFRYQYWDDYDIDEYRPVDGRGGRTDGFFDMRLKLNVTAVVNEQITLFVEGIDARRWSYDDGPNAAFGLVTPVHVYRPGVNHLDLHQAWALVSNPGGLPVAFKVGRQEVNLGSGRVQGGQPWQNSPGVFDAAVMLVPLDPVTIAVWYGKAVVFPNSSSFDHVLNRFDYYGVYSMWKLPDIDAFDVYWMHLVQDTGMLVPGDIRIHAVGMRLQDTVAEQIHYGFETVFEFGEVGPLTLQAHAFHGELGYSLTAMPWTPMIMFEYNRATGDSGGVLGDTQLNSFFTWFPSYHGMFGIMDMFQWSNIEHYKLGCTFHPHERVKLAMAGHIFYLDHSGDRWFMGRSGVPAPLLG